MTATPKKEFMRRKYEQRRAAGLSEIKLYVNDKIKNDVLDYYHDLCDRFEIPVELRPKR